NSECARTLEIPDHAVLDMHGRSRLNCNPVDASVTPIDDQAAQADNVANTCGDDNAIVSEGGLNDCRAGAVVCDMDRMGNGHRAVGAGTDDDDLAPGKGLRQRTLEGYAGNVDIPAIVQVAASVRDEGPKALCHGGCSVQKSEHCKGDERQRG